MNDPNIVLDRWRDPDTERSVLGDVLGHANQFPAYRTAGLTADAFDRDCHRRVWSACESLLADRVDVDMIAVRTRLADLGDLADVGVAYLMGLPDGVPKQGPSNVRYLTDRLTTFQRCRRLYYGDIQLHQALAKDPAAINNGVVDRRIEELTALQAPAAGERFRLLDDVELMQQPEPVELVERRLPEHILAVLFGPPGVGKTFVVIDLGSAIATGGTWLGAPVKQMGPVVHVVAEGAAAVQRRVRAWKVAHGFSLDNPIGFVVLPEAVNLLSDGDVGAFIKPSPP